MNSRRATYAAMAKQFIVDEEHSEQCRVSGTHGHPVTSSPWIESVIRHQLDSASQFLGALQATAVGLESSHHFEGLCRRCEANVDALRIGGQAVIRIVQAVTEVDGELASVVALLLAEAEIDQPATSEQAVSLLRHESPEIRQAAWRGLRLASCRHTELHLRAILRRSKWDFAPAAGLDILAFHRLPVHAEIGEPPNEDGDEIAWLLAEAGGRLCGAWNAAHLNQFLRHSSARVREATLRASARCGLPELPAYCREATLSSAPHEAIEFLGVVGSQEDLSCLRQVAEGSTDAVAAKASVNALGRLGLPSAGPCLLKCLSRPDLADYVATAFERITGIPAPRGPALPPPSHMTEDELDFWTPPQPVDVDALRTIWHPALSRLDPSKRWQMGLNVSDDPLGPVFDQLPPAVRYDVYLRERALRHDATPDWELETWWQHQRNPRWGWAPQ